MASFDGLEVDVGDKKTLEVVSSDTAGNTLPSVSAEVVVSSPSAEETTYHSGDMRQSETALYLDVLFDEPGFWYLDVRITNAGGQESDNGYIRAVTKAPAEMSLLTREVWHDYLSEEAMAAGAARLQKLISAAEEKVLERYRETTPRTRDLILEEHYDSDIRLDGWIETDQGEPDLTAMDSELLDGLRRVVARLVGHEVTTPDSHILRIDQGERRVDYKPDAGELPSGIYLPLTDFDERRRFHF